MSNIGGIAGGAGNLQLDPNLEKSSSKILQDGDSAITDNIDELKDESPEFFLNMMKEMQAETRAFEAVTNVLKARDDAAKSAIRNIK